MTGRACAARCSASRSCGRAISATTSSGALRRASIPPRLVPFAIWATNSSWRRSLSISAAVTVIVLRPQPDHAIGSQQSPRTRHRRRHRNRPAQVFPSTDRWRRGEIRQERSQRKPGRAVGDARAYAWPAPWARSVDAFGVAPDPVTLGGADRNVEATILIDVAERGGAGHRLRVLRQPNGTSGETSLTIEDSEVALGEGREEDIEPAIAIEIDERGRLHPRLLQRAQLDALTNEPRPADVGEEQDSADVLIGTDQQVGPAIAMDVAARNRPGRVG